jgi:uncharacterized membrane protein YdjX (TVP38/TMEM64 family)
MKRARTTRQILGRSLLYVYHPIVTKLAITFVFLGLLLITVLQPSGRLALNGVHQALDAFLLPTLFLLAVLFALSTLSPFFPEFLVTVAAGFLLGTVAGGLFAVLLITLCASGNFWIARRWGRSVIHLIFDTHSRAEIRWTATRISPLMVFLTWFLPSINFDLISYAGGLSAMSYRAFLALTVVGNLLSSILLAFLGSRLRSDASVVVVGTLILYTAIGMVLYARELPGRGGG